MLIRLLIAATFITVGAATWVTCWVAFPIEANLEVDAPLEAWSARDPSRGIGRYAIDFPALADGFRSQKYRSFCGPASIATVLRAYGVKQADQDELFSSPRFKLDAFYTGMSLAEMAKLTRQTGLRAEVVYADRLTLDAFRNRLKGNLSRAGDFVVINYDRRVLKQAGAGHISPVGAYDAARDAFLVLDQAAFKYPFTWVPAPLLYEAVHTRDGDWFRGVLFIDSYAAGGEGQ